MPRSRGFTLVELLVVLVIVALVSAGVVVSLPDQEQSRLHREALRIGTILEIARAKSRASGEAVVVNVSGTSLQFSGTGSQKPHTKETQEPGVSLVATQLVLGPDPVIPAQSLTLQGQGGRHLVIATDGVRPFGLRSVQ